MLTDQPVVFAQTGDAAVAASNGGGGGDPGDRAGDTSESESTGNDADRRQLNSDVAAPEVRGWFYL